MKRLNIFFLCLALCAAGSLHAQNNNEIMQQIKQMREETDPAKSTALMNKIVKENHLQEEKDAEMIDMMKGDVAMDYLQSGKYNEFEKCIYTMSNKFNQTSFLNFGATSLAENGKDLHIAEGLAKKTLELYHSFKDDPKARPNSISQQHWDRFMRFARFPYCDTYAMALYARGKNKEALLYQEKAFDGAPEAGQPSSVERYAHLLALNNEDEKAYSLLLQLAKTGKSTAGMNKLLKELYVKRNKDATGFDAFFEGIQKNVVVALKEEFRKKMQDIEAPGFTLKDLDGNNVSLADYKGKTVVVDLWATWCLPCKASFPAMKKMMQQHPEVVFLFIATQEKQDGALNRVKNFITQNQYPFHVLMDEPMENNRELFKALSAFKPEGIPAKVVIDAKGRQRFLSIGFSSDTQLINEMEAMIQLINEPG